jgi:acetoacetyl-CoA synthetase
MGATTPVKLWDPPASLRDRARMTEFIAWLAAERGLEFDGYDELWRWSVADLEGFWSAIWEFFDVRADGDPSPVLAGREMPGAEWFPNTRLNYAEHVFAAKDPAETAILHASELRDLEELSWGELREQVAAVAAGLRGLGIERGDRVVAFMPNIR